ncbi:hypothetical protein Pint_30664 [Pistacia integerrima]|uniref:Uncharacterized protein n=1 Tax=Pistacia integerrima TaxID=434235 RepID=A0ACC0X1U4_9ROSI|nr:hypothetical protein Pint_30664 [Pistacia integerrima]
MFGTPSFASLRFVGQLNAASIQIFVDGGLTLNFIQPRVAKYLGLAIEAILPPTTMVVRDGAKVPIKGCVHSIKITIQGHDIVVDLYLLPFHGLDVLLGITWLSTFGTLSLNFNTLILGFTSGDKMVELQRMAASIALIQYSSFVAFKNPKCRRQNLQLQNRGNDLVRLRPPAIRCTCTHKKTSLKLTESTRVVFLVGILAQVNKSGRG